RAPGETIVLFVARWQPPTSGPEPAQESWRAAVWQCDRASVLSASHGTDAGPSGARLPAQSKRDRQNGVRAKNKIRPQEGGSALRVRNHQTGVPRPTVTRDAIMETWEIISNLGHLVYALLAYLILAGTYYSVLLFRRIRQKKFPSLEASREFL